MSKKCIIPEGIDRRQFLSSAAVTTVAVGATGSSTLPADGKAPQVRPTEPLPTAPPDPEAVFRRQAFELVTARNRLRKEAQLPALNVELEVRQLLWVHREQQYTEFYRAHSDKAKRVLNLKTNYKSMDECRAEGSAVHKLVWEWWCMGSEP